MAAGRRLGRRLAWSLAGVLAVLAAVLLWAEAAGWPFLAAPAERYLSAKLQRSVSLRGDDGHGFQLKLLGRVRLDVAHLVVGNAPWSTLGPMVTADDAHLELRWRDLLAARGGRPLRLARLSAHALAIELERLKDGRASWQLGKPRGPDAPAEKPAISGIDVGELRVDDGTLALADAVLPLQLQGRFATRAPALEGHAGWVAEATGRYRGSPLRAEVRTGSTVLWMGGRDDDAPELPISLDVSAGAARVRFDGMTQDVLGRAGVRGRYAVSGPSLAAIGEPFGVTLPQTPPFSMKGTIVHGGTRWSTLVQAAQIGRSHLWGQFDYDRPADKRPLLTGQLRGSDLWLQDLGPAVGAAPGAAAAPAPRHAGRVLPDRSFDLPSLSRMDADVRVDLDHLELGHPRLQALRPLRGHIVLRDGVLDIEDLDARLAQGRVSGHVRLDGRQPSALWNVDLLLRGVVLEQWISQPRANGAPPYIAGRMTARMQLEGHGRSTADLLATSNGRGWIFLDDGKISHLAVEAAGIDIGQALGVMVKGDDALPITCGAADLDVKQGRVVPRALIVDTHDSTIWGQGSISLADETLDLVARVEPKDVSPLALRSPVHVRGTLGAPQVSVEKAPLARRLVPAALLAMLNPIAALIPLVDLGDDNARQAASSCRDLLQRNQSKQGSPGKK